MNGTPLTQELALEMLRLMREEGKRIRFDDRNHFLQVTEGWDKEQQVYFRDSQDLYPPHDTRRMVWKEDEFIEYLIRCWNQEKFERWAGS